jgi:tRNA (guanosine-2'-O-)-methyltransferase
MNRSGRTGGAPSDRRGIADWKKLERDLSEEDGRGEVWDLLAPFTTEQRLERIEAVLAARTDKLVLVLDNLYDPHNLSAIMRTAEAFGVQHLILTGQAPAGFNPRVALGTQHWLTLHREEDASLCLQALKTRGYAVIVSVLSPEAVPLAAFVPEGPVALVLGNEREGVTPFWVDRADALLTIPLDGFVGSLNVSVAAGILIASLLDSPALSERGLPDAEARRLADLWIRRSVTNSADILKRLRGED